MNVRKFLTAVTATVLGILNFTPSVAELREPPAAEAIAKFLAETAKIEEVLLSPDGRWVAYGVKRGSVTNNESKTEWLLQASAGVAVVRLPEKASAIRWCPDSSCLSLILASGSGDTPADLIRYELASGKLTAIPVKKSPGIKQVGPDYRWSPQGRFIAFTAELPAPARLDPRRGVAFETYMNAFPSSALFVLEVSSGALSQLTSDALRVKSKRFAWSPDERSLVVTVDRTPDSNLTDTDLVVVDRESGASRDLVAQPGGDDSPLWSPDGRWIAFSSRLGVPDYQFGWPAVVPAAGGTAIGFPQASKGTPEYWSADSKHFFYRIDWQMARTLVRADIESHQIGAPLPLPNSGLDLPFDSHHSFSADGRRVAFVRSAIASPPEVFVADLEKQGRTCGNARQITAISAGFALRDLARTELLSWPSPDGKFTIHGLLITPVSAWSKGKILRSLPTLLSLHGGPSMVIRGFAGDGWNEARLPMALRGYAVLVPNTRGRGGYGDEFQFAIREGKSSASLPLQDAMAAIDLLIESGIADPDRLGILGHSYGGFLTEYAITQTDRFKGAVAHEAHVVEMLGGGYTMPDPGWMTLLDRDLFGIHDPFDPTERARLLAESPGLNANRVKTPTLLLFAGRTPQHAGHRIGRYFYNALIRFNVPTALFLYDEDHVFMRPAAVADDLTRTMEWLDYWVRGIPWPDAQRAQGSDPST